MPQAILNCPEEIDILSEEYFAECIENKRPLTYAGLAQALGFARSESLKDYMTDDSKAEFHEAMSRACLEVEKFMEEMLYSKNCNIAGPIFALKARIGLRDKDKDDKGTVVVKVEGVAAKF